MKDAIDFLDRIEGHGYGGMADYEVARTTVRLRLEWQPIEITPHAPVAVELYYANLEDALVIEPYRDCRRELGYWDGETFCELGTGHSCFESWRDPDQMPTHWRELGPAPASERDMEAGR
jgi:hypothetical protein